MQQQCLYPYAYSHMRCDWQDMPGTTDERGWRRVRCTRHKCQLGSGIAHTPHPHEKIHAECYGTPRWHEIGNWVEILLAAIGITKNRVSLVSRRSCHCDQRAEALNTIGSRFANGFTALRHKTQQAVVLCTRRLLGFCQQLFPGDRHLGGGPDADTDLVPRPDSQNLHDDVAVDDDP